MGKTVIVIEQMAIDPEDGNTDGWDVQLQYALDLTDLDHVNLLQRQISNLTAAYQGSEPPEHVLAHRVSLWRLPASLELEDSE